MLFQDRYEAGKFFASKVQHLQSARWLLAEFSLSPPRAGARLFEMNEFAGGSMKMQDDAVVQFPELKMRPSDECRLEGTRR
jgi:hypothetical protein